MYYITNRLAKKIFTSFEKNMKIITSNSFKTPSIVFGENRKTPKNENILPTKFVLTETEEHFGETLQKLYRLERDIKTQKQNLRDFYSAQDKFEYRDLLKERRSIIAKLKREARKAGMKYTDLEYDVNFKKEYNRYAAKVLRAKTLEDLKPIFDLINSCEIYQQTKDLLINLIKQMKLTK